MQALITDVDRGIAIPMQFEVDPSDGEWQTLTAPPLPAGTYRIEVSADRDAEPIADLFVVG